LIHINAGRCPGAILTSLEGSERGWVVGDTPPADRVETWSCCVKDAGRGKRYVEWTRIWTNSDVALSERNRLRKRFWDVVDVGTINQALGRPQATS
jgi:hypothetical protein